MGGGGHEDGTYRWPIVYTASMIHHAYEARGNGFM